MNSQEEDVVDLLLEPGVLLQLRYTGQATSMILVYKTLHIEDGTTYIVPERTVPFESGSVVMFLEYHEEESTKVFVKILHKDRVVYMSTGTFFHWFSLL